MRLSFWNCRGLTRSAATNSIRAIERKDQPDVIFLSEIKVSTAYSILAPFGYVNLVKWPTNCRKGGVALAWKIGVDVEVTQCCENFISAFIYSDPPDTPWLLTGVYTPTKWSKKKNFWQSLKAVVDYYNGPWLCVGDFNSIISSEEKQGGQAFASSSVGDLHMFINQMGLIDLGSMGLQ